tara:strand:+ start:265 stop:669 length:405 start_codon:yes stop_codon:yes gene_type:complete
MQILYKNEPLTTIYQCDEGGIHLVTHNVNIGMQVKEFFSLNEEVQSAFNAYQANEWPSPYIALTYQTTVVCLNSNDLPELSEAMQTSVEHIQNKDGFAAMESLDHSHSNGAHLSSLPEPEEKIKNLDSFRMSEN